MNRIPLQVLPLLVLAVLAPVEGYGQARVPPKAAKPAVGGTGPGDADESRARQVALLEEWLGRFPGHYQVRGLVEFPTGIYEPVGVTGRGDCVRIGEGSGAHCVMNFEWPTITPNGFRVPESRYTPMVVMFGFDPDAPGLHYLQVNDRSIAEAAFGTLKADTANFETSCVNRTWDIPASCTRRVQVIMKPGRRVVEMIYTTSLRPEDLKPYVVVSLQLIRQEDRAAPDSRRRPTASLP